LARLLDRHEVVGEDLVNHCVNDALAMGAEPLFFLDYFATSRIDPPVFARVVGAMARARVLGPEGVREGDVLIGLPSSGLHTNGYSLAREILARAAGSEARTLSDLLGESRRDLADQTIGEALLATHRSYLEDFRLLRDAARVHSIAHITGGGWEGNLPRALPDGLAAAVDRGAWSAPRVFTLLAELGRIAEP